MVKVVIVAAAASAAVGGGGDVVVKVVIVAAAASAAVGGGGVGVGVVIVAAAAAVDGGDVLSYQLGQVCVTLRNISLSPMSLGSSCQRVTVAESQVMNNVTVVTQVSKSAVSCQTPQQYACFSPVHSECLSGCVLYCQ